VREISWRICEKRRGRVTATGHIYLHYVLDLWAHHWRKKQAFGDAILVRYADGTPVQKSNLWGASPLIPNRPFGDLVGSRVEGASQRLK
jgi:hypothetical protein